MQLTKKEIFFTGLALLAMFFGAGNLIFPPNLGQQAGEHLWPAILGFIITGVGLPLMGITAVAKVGGDLEYLANRVHPIFSKVITTVVVLSIGPLLAIPRTAATTYEVAIVPFLGNASDLSLAIMSFVYFTIVLLFVLRGSKIVDDVGKVLTPFLIIFLAIVIIKGILYPQGTIGTAQFELPFSKGFLEGYNTMDALASVIFGMVIVNALRAKGITDKKVIEKATIWSGIIAAIGLSSIYMGLAYIGATTGSNFTGDNPGQMLSYITTTLLGPLGKIVIAIAMSLACLTTAIGLVACCGNFFSRLSNYRISYNRVCIITVLVSLLLANMGLARILEISVPLLVTVYPIIIVLVILALCHNLFKGKRMVYITTIIGTSAVVLTGLVEMIAAKIGIDFQMTNSLLAMIPWHDQGLGWVIPALLTAIFGLLISPKTKQQI
ncbi:branched-chain amino acid transport system II carrier protein [Desulfotomaculum defluvii]